MTWASDIEAVQSESGGLLQLDIVEPRDLPGLLGAALAGDVEARRLAGAARNFLHQIHKAPRKRVALCACCPRPLLGGRFICAIATPSREDPAQGIAFDLCDRCVPDAASVRPKALDALRGIFPDAQSVDITHPAGGRA